MVILIAIVYFQPIRTSSQQPLNPMDKQPLSEITEQSDLTKAQVAVLPDIKIIDRPIAWSKNRERLMNEYAKIHYGLDIDKIDPKAIVVHWTVTKDATSVYNYFYQEDTNDPELTEYGKLNVASHFLVDRDGTIFRLTPETALNRHAIGLNWCAIGIENVGGVNGKEDLTNEQLTANLNLIRYLKAKFPKIEYVLGHYQQIYARKTELWIENVPDYYAEKIDPGSKFMGQLHHGLSDTELKFFPEKLAL